MAADIHQDPQTARRDRRVMLGMAALAAATVLVGALAPAPSPSQPSAPSPATASRPERNSACAEWSDGCKVCRRTEDGPACSLPGIACTPGATTCLRSAGEP